MEMLLSRQPFAPPPWNFAPENLNSPSKESGLVITVQVRLESIPANRFVSIVVWLIARLQSWSARRHRSDFPPHESAIHGKLM